MWRNRITRFERWGTSKNESVCIKKKSWRIRHESLLFCWKHVQGFLKKLSCGIKWPESIMIWWLRFLVSLPRQFLKFKVNIKSGFHGLQIPSIALYAWFSNRLSPASFAKHPQRSLRESNPKSLSSKIVMIFKDLKKISLQL